MRSFGAERQNYYTSNTIAASYSIIAEWNMNEYFYASHSGTYIGKSSDYSSTYSASDSKILTGNNLLIFEDDDIDAIMDDPTNEWMTSISSIFQPRRPDPNILLLQYNPNSKMVSREWWDYSVKTRGAMNSACPRYYACNDSYNSYDYWISSKAYSASTYYNEDISKGVSGVSGSIEMSKPFIKYNSSFPCNKIVIKTQKHLGVPSNFKVDILTSASPASWTNIYSTTTSVALSSGILELYRQSSGNWSTAEKFATDISTITSSAQTDIIIGIRFWVNNMSSTQIPLEVIEISPRLVVDVTSITKSLSISSNMGESEYGLPVGNIVTTSGDIEFFNENNEFLSNGILSSSYNIIKPNVKFIISQVLSGVKYQIKEMYANSWDTSSDFSTNVDLEDAMKFFRNKDAPEIVLRSQNGIPLSTCILTLLDNIGFTGFNMRTTASGIDDVRINTFFSYKEDTVLEVLEKLANATQCSMYINSVGELNVITKEKIVQRFSSASSTSISSDGTDIWFIGNSSSAGQTENASISGYVSNITTLDETKYLPITDGKVGYTIYDIERKPFSDLEEIAKMLRAKRKDSNDPENSNAVTLTYSTYSYKPKKLWSIGEDDSSGDSTLGFSILSSTINDKKVSQIAASVLAYDEEDAIRSIYYNATDEQKKSLRIILAQNVDEHGIFTFSNYAGYVRINNEVIRYYGKIYEIFSNSTPVASRIFFNDNELQQYVQDSQIETLRIVPKGLIIAIDFKITAESGSKYIFSVIGDGRGSLGTSMRQHKEYTSITYVNESDKFSFYLGDIQSAKRPKCSVSSEYQNNLIGRKKGNFPRGYLRVAGPPDSFNTTNLPSVKDPTDLDSYIINGANSERWITGYNLAYNNTRRRVGFPQEIETKMSIIKDSGKSLIAGLCFGFDRNDPFGNGIFIEFDGRPSTTLYNMRAYALSGKRNSRTGKVSTNDKILSVCQVVFKTKPKVNMEQELPTDENGIVTDFKVKVSIKPLDRRSNKYFYAIYWENKLVMTFVYKKPATKNVGFFVRGDSVATFDYISVETFSSNSGGSKRFFDDFGTAVKEIQEFNPRWDSIALSTLLVAPDRTFPDYSIYNNPRTTTMTLEKQKYAPNFNYYGGRFYLENTSNRAVKISEFPISVTGIAIDVVDEAEISVSSYLDSFDTDAKKVSSIYLNRNLYDDKSFDIQSEFIQSRAQAKAMMNWIMRNATKQRLGFNLGIFPTPLIELGDRARLFYSQKGYNMNNSGYGDKCYMVSGINYSIDESGPSMSVDIIEVSL